MNSTEPLTMPASPPTVSGHRFGLPATSLPLAAWLVAFAGLFAAAILSVGHILDLPVPCGGSRGCNAVAAHPSSKLFGVPIAYIGVTAYVAILFLLTNVATRWARIALLAITASGTLASGYLLYHSQTVIGASCPWCIASGAAMAVLLVLASIKARIGGSLTAPRGRWPFALGLLTAAAIGVQGGRIHRSANEPPIPAEQLVGLSARDLVVDGKALGPADAPVTVVVFADLWCPACRTAHHALVDFQKAHPANVRIAFRHLPLETLRGHEMSGAAAALSELAAEKGKFWEFAGIINKLPGQVNRDGYRTIVKHLGLDPDEAEKRIANVEDPAVTRVYRDIHFAEGLGINSTPTFIVLLDGRSPTSASLRTLPKILNSPLVQSRLAAKADPGFKPKP